MNHYSNACKEVLAGSWWLFCMGFLRAGSLQHSIIWTKIIYYNQFSEWKTYVCTGKLKETTYLERYVALFNGVSRWVQGMVLNCVTPQERACCMEKFQQTAKVSYKLIKIILCMIYFVIS